MLNKDNMLEEKITFDGALTTIASYFYNREAAIMEYKEDDKVIHVLVRLSVDPVTKELIAHPVAKLWDENPAGDILVTTKPILALQKSLPEWRKHIKEISSEQVLLN